ncbi:hypothetical protein ACOMHN_038638 [Nucella lapillus]
MHKRPLEMWSNERAVQCGGEGTQPLVLINRPWPESDVAWRWGVDTSERSAGDALQRCWWLVLHQVIDGCSS